MPATWAYNACLLLSPSVGPLEHEQPKTWTSQNLDEPDVPTGSIKIEIVQGLPTLSNSENEVLEKLEQESRVDGNI